MMNSEGPGGFGGHGNPATGQPYGHFNVPARGSWGGAAGGNNAALSAMNNYLQQSPRMGGQGGPQLPPQTTQQQTQSPKMGGQGGPQAPQTQQQTQQPAQPAAAPTWSFGGVTYPDYYSWQAARDSQGKAAYQANVAQNGTMDDNIKNGSLVNTPYGFAPSGTYLANTYGNATSDPGQLGATQSNMAGYNYWQQQQAAGYPAMQGQGQQAQGQAQGQQMGGQQQQYQGGPLPAQSMGQGQSQPQSVGQGQLTNGNNPNTLTQSGNGSPYIYNQQQGGGNQTNTFAPSGTPQQAMQGGQGQAGGQPGGMPQQSQALGMQQGAGMFGVRPMGGGGGGGGGKSAFGSGGGAGSPWG